MLGLAARVSSGSKSEDIGNIYIYIHTYIIVIHMCIDLIILCLSKASGHEPFHSPDPSGLGTAWLCQVFLLVLQVGEVDYGSRHPQGG